MAAGLGLIQIAVPKEHIQIHHHLANGRTHPVQRLFGDKISLEVKVAITEQSYVQL